MDGKVVIGTELDTTDFEAEIDYVKSKMDDLEDKFLKADMGIEVGDTLKLEAEYSKLSKQLGNLTKKQKAFNEAQEKSARINFDNVEESIDNIGSKLTKVVKKVGKWSLAVFGVRAAYGAIRKSTSILSEYNEGLANSITNIQYSLSTALEPIVTRIVNLIYKLMQYINYLTQSWFNFSLFSDKAADSLSSASGSAKEIKKSLAGFDEMNVLSDTSDTGASSSYTPTGIGSLTEAEIPNWLLWLKTNGSELIPILAGIAAGIIAINLGANIFLGLGIGLILGGIVDLIGNIIDFINDPTWNNFANILISLSTILAGVVVVMLALNAASPLTWILLVIAAVGALTAVVIKNWDNIKSALSSVGTWINDHIIKPISNFFAGLLDGIKNAVKSTVEWVKDKFESIVTFFSSLINKIVTLFKTIGTKVGDVIGSAFKAVINGVLSAIENILNFPIKSINKLIKTINKVPGINLDTLSTFSLPRLAKGGIINQPGRGVAIGGESGREGVIPLTDSQQMATLGEAIGKYITINASITNTMNGRVISRELQKVQSANNFAMNR